jgi:damage-control phosphatase, subfamily I
MRMIPGCVPCLVQMAITTAQMGDADEKTLLEAGRAAMRILADADYSHPAPYFSEPILQKVYQLIHNPDPFEKAKHDANRVSLRLAEELARPYLGSAKDDRDRVLRSIRASIAGNIADYAVVPDLAGREEEYIREAFELEFSMQDFEKFYGRLKSAKKILFLCDNAGEVAFDRVLIEEFSRLGKTTTVAVKSGPALNDALMGDAVEVGLDKVANVKLIETGQSRMGVDLASASGEFQSAWEKADLVIAKGQANFESLAGKNGKLFFLTMIKCKALEQKLGLKKGSAIFISGETYNGQFGKA